MRGDEIHQAERERLDARMRGDRLDVAQRAVGLDQRVQRDRAGTGARVDGGSGAIDVGDAVDLGQHQVGQARAGGADDGRDVGGERGVVDRMDARADAAEAVLCRLQRLGDEVRMLGLGADRRAVFAIERHVEHRAELALQREALLHQRFDAGVVVARRQRRGRLAGVEEHVPRRTAGAHRRVSLRAGA